MQVIKIIEGGIDLRSGEEISLGLVITNGIREFTIPISSEILNHITLMIAEEKPGKPIVEGPVKPASEIPPAALSPAGGDLNPFREETQTTPRLVEEEPTLPQNPLDEDEGFEPGEEYNDIGTGAGSL